jgi:hypothetical protein
MVSLSVLVPLPPALPLSLLPLLSSLQLLPLPLALLLLLLVL